MSESPDALAAVVGRVEHQLSLNPTGSAEYFLRAADLRLLLAALAEAQADKERLDWFDRIWKDDDINALDLAWQSSTPGPAGSGRAAIDAAIAATKQGTR